MKRLALLTIALFLFLPAPETEAAVIKASYPRLANYYLKWELTASETEELAKWDLLILDMENQENNPEELRRLRQLNPDIIILAYLNSVELNNGVENYRNAYLRYTLKEGLDASWWLKDASGQGIENWPDTLMLNLTDGCRTDNNGQRYYDYLPEFVVDNIKASGLWDGIFYDNTWGDVSWINGGDIDADNDGLRDSGTVLDQAWARGFQKMLAKTRALAGSDFIIVGNGRVYEGYQKLLNGMMLEDFPSTWENGGTWAGSMKTYFKLPSLNLKPQITVVNSFDKNQANYRAFRFGLASTLLGSGYYSYDYDTSAHNQTWWYDEYDFNLGSARGTAYNVLASGSTETKAGLWRRDFQNGLALVNASGRDQTYIFSKENVQKLEGAQDPSFNNGDKINYIKLANGDGAILKRQDSYLSDTVFTNGYFYRVYGRNGQQAQTGFFSYLPGFAGGKKVLVASQEDSDLSINLSAGSGLVELKKNGNISAAFYPYSKNYRGSLNIAAKIDNGYFRLVVTGTGPGAGPQIGIFQPGGKMLGSFFAYDKNNRGGVNVALGDIDNDGLDEIITGPGRGLEPLIKVFSQQGKVKSSFLAYDKNFRGGVSVALGDIDGDGRLEIITGPGAGGGPHIRIFNSQGKVMSSFFAFDQKYRGGLEVGSGDSNGDGQDEIYAGIKDFY